MVHNLYISDYSVGAVGSTHDSEAFQDTRVFKNPRLLRPGEWIWGDSAYYPVRPWCIPPFKTPTNGELTRQQKQFNYLLSSVRVSVEHAFGLLKGRWQSLKEIRIQVSDERARGWMRNWIKACFILHNLCIIFEGDHGDEEGRRQMMTLGRDEWRDVAEQGGVGEGTAAEGTDGASGDADPRRTLMQAAGLV